MTSLSEFSFRCWSAWAPAMAAADSWQAWARGEMELVAVEETAAVAAMPPLLRRRANPLGRAALEVLYAPALAYTEQPIVFCSRQGETARSLTIQLALAAADPVSPQEFSMAVHNAIPGLFMVARQSRATVIALASENRLLLSGLVETLSQLADGASSAILLFCDEPLPPLFRAFTDNEPTCFAFALEMTAGHDYRLVHGETEPSPQPALPPTGASSLPLLRFVLDETQKVLPLTAAADWRLLRLAPEAGHA